MRNEINKQAKLWQLRLGHARPLRDVRKLFRDVLLSHVPCRAVDCDTCAKKKIRKRYTGSLTNAASVGTLHCDTKGTFETNFIDGKRYFLKIVEDQSRCTLVTTLRTKCETSDALLRFIRFFKKQSGHTVRTVDTDGGTELRRALRKLDAQGVKFSVTTAYTPQSNGLAERSHSTKESLTGTCLHHD